MAKTTFKILMIAPTPFFADRGCHTQILEEIKALRKRGHGIVLCTYGFGRDIPGVDIRRCWNFPWYKKLSAGPSITKIFLLPLLTLSVFKTIRSFKPDIIHAHLHEGVCIAKFCSFFYRRKKYLFDMQGSLTGELLQHGFVAEGGFIHHCFIVLEKMIAGWFPVITQSESMLEELKRLRKSDKSVHNVKDGVDTDAFKPRPFCKKLAGELGVDENRKRVLFMGLLEEYQGVDIMLKAFSLVAKREKMVQFIIIGYPNIEKYSSLCEGLDIADNVLFLGRVNYENLPEYLSLSQIAVAPKIALTEGDGKIYNYMAMGMATVAFDRPVAREILGDAGIYCPIKDANAMSDAIINIMNSSKTCIKKGIIARKRAVDKLSWDAVAERIENVYNSVNNREARVG